MLSFEVQIFSSCNLESAINKTEKPFSLIGYAKEDIHGKIAEGLVFFDFFVFLNFFWITPKNFSGKNLRN